MDPLVHTKLIYIYSKNVRDKVKEIEKSIKERATSYTAPIFAEKSCEWMTAVWFIVVILAPEVPFNSIARNHKINYIRKQLQASLRNWSPQISSITLNIWRATLWELERNRSPSLRYGSYWVPKATYCQIISTINPKVKTRKSRI